MTGQANFLCSAFAFRIPLTDPLFGIQFLLETGYRAVGNSAAGENSISHLTTSSRSIIEAMQSWPFTKSIRKYVRFLPLVSILGTLAGLLEGLGVGIVIPLIALLLADKVPAGIPAPLQSLAESSAQLEPTTRIMVLGGAVLVLVLGKSFVQAANNLLIGRINAKVERDLRVRLAERLLSLDYPFFMTADPARLIKVISTDCWKAADASRASLSIVPAATGLIVSALFLVWLDWRLFAIVLCIGALIQFILHLMHEWQRRLSRGAVEEYRMMTARTLSIISAARVIRLFGQQEREKASFTAATERVRLRVIAERNLIALIVPGVEVMAAVIFVAVLIAGYALGVSVPEVIGFLVLLARAQPNAQAINRARVAIASEQGPIEEVEWLLKQEPASLPPVRAVGCPPRPVGSIRFEAVSYDYPDGTPALRDIDVVLRAGVATALFGKSGSGKTTLVNLLCRLIEPRSGKIFAGDRAIGECDAEQWRQLIAVAGQNADLVTGTVRENIAYGCPGASDKDVKEAAQAAWAAEFIDQLPRGFDTRVGPEGLSLSGGQRQRIGLARALLKRPELLILDEATNAVDALAETEIMKLLTERRFFRSALVISHRRSTLTLCEDGIVIDDGRIVESGPLRSLAYFQTMMGETT
jgi:ATP-binding cassette, subfamily B, bacterial MsbA